MGATYGPFTLADWMYGTAPERSSMEDDRDEFEPDATEVGLTHAEESDDFENPAYGPGNPDWEHDRAREDERG